MQATQSLALGRAGYAQWEHSVRSICGRFESRAPDRIDDFFGRIVLNRAEGFEFADVSTNARALAKSPLDVRREDGQFYFLIHQASGTSVLSQGGRQAMLAAGDSALIDSRSGSEFVYLGGMRHISLHLPCEAVERRLQGRRPRLCETIPGSSPFGAVLGRFIDEIASRHTLFGERDGAAMGEALLALLAPLADDTELAGGRLRDQARVAAYIEARLGDELDVETMARACAISVRSLYRLFEERGSTLGTFVRERRLARCAQALAAPASRHESVTQIALRWGFKDCAHFSRCFRAHFGMAPRDYRAAKKAEGRRGG